ncbi:hypothetical protein [Novosphingobium terrae]|uniref:hypothetical protein n=1 Tax=Novosphingobium terrae TaxID=2726189 RepID=UPI00197CC4DA|nr:hypothetical protein [Novosphingobium terrae]
MNTKMYVLRSVAVAAALAILPQAAPALAGESTVHLQLSAFVPTFCRISSPAPDGIFLHDGQATLGTVQEICNDPSGYRVSSNFTNLDSGALLVGSRRLDIVNGLAERTENNAAVSRNSWSLVQAKAVNAELPILLTVTISPA